MGSLRAFQAGVHDTFSYSEAKLSHHFSVELEWRLIAVETLYQNTPPQDGVR